MIALLIGTVLKATLLLAVVFALTVLLRDRSAALRHLIWSAGLAGLLALPLLSFALPWRLAMLPPLPLAPTSVGGSEGAAATIGRTIASPAKPQVGPPASRAGASGSATEAFASGLMPETVLLEILAGPRDASGSLAGDVGGSPASDAEGSLASAPAASGSLARFPAVVPVSIVRVPWVEQAPRIVFLLWLIGAVLVLARLLLGVVAIRRIASGAEPLEASEWTGALKSVARRIGLRTTVQLLRSPASPMPITFGILRPTIVLPVASVEWDDARRRAVLLHEVAHVQRLDLAPHVLAWVACALYWFHPLVWIAAGRLRHESERACDDLVLGAGMRPSDYAEHLLQIARAAGRGRAPAPAVPMAQRSRFEGRLLAILEPDTRRHRVTLAGLAAILALIGFLVVPLAAIGPADPAAGVIPSDGASTRVGRSTDRSTEARLAGNPSGARAVVGDPITSTLRLDERGRIGDALDGDALGGDALGRDARLDNAALGGAVLPFAPLSAQVASEVSAEEAVAIGERVRALAGALGDPVLEVRSAAVHALGELEDPRAVAALARVLREDPEPEVRRMAAWALGEIEDPAAVPALSSAVQDDRAPEVRAMAAWALGEIESAEGVPALGEALGDNSAEVRENALWALGEIESPDAVPWLVRALGDSEPGVRRQAVWALGEIESAAAVDPLMRALGDRDAEVRGMAIWALGEIEDPRAIPAILPTLTDGDVEVRRKAVWAIGELQPVSAPPALIAATRDGDAEVRKTAAWALGEIGDGAAVPGLQALLDDGEPEVRHAAVWALVELEDPAAYEVLVELLKDEDPEVRKAAAQALGDR